MSGAHAFLPPSSAAAWVVCNLWPTMNARYPELAEGVEAAEGTAAHWVFEQMLHQRPVAEGAIAGNGVPVTVDMLEGADTYVAEVGRAYASLASVTHYAVEQRVQIPAVHINNWGTPDTWIFGHNPTSGRARLVVVDYKFGKEFVEVFENWQLVDYAIGILDELGVDGAADELVDLEFVVVQPRSYHKDGTIRRWTTRASNLRALANKLRNAAEGAHMPNPTAHPEPDNCKHCPGRHACEALQREGYKSADLAGMSSPVEMPLAAAGLELQMLTRAAALLKARVSGLEEQVEHALRAGGTNPYYDLQPGEAKLVWTKPAGEVIALGQLVGVALAKPPEPITPTQAKKVMDPALVDVYSERTKPPLKLTAVSSVQTRKVFGNNS